MNIVIFGNTNNFPLLLAEQFRQQGINIDLVINRKDPLHRPENKFPQYKKSYPEWIHDYSDLNDKTYLFLHRLPDSLKILFNKADYLILNDIGPALLPWFRKPAIAFLTGSDLDYYANYDNLDLIVRNKYRNLYDMLNMKLTRAYWWNMIRRQRQGIRLAKAVSFFPEGIVPDSDSLLADIGVSDGRRFHIYMADTDHIQYCPPGTNNEIVTLFYGARLTWSEKIAKGNSALDYKGTDVLLKGLRQYLDEGGTNINLRLVKKGRQVNETLQLCEQLHLGQYVHFLEEMPLHVFHEELRQADICIDGVGQSPIGMTGLDSMATGRPLIANARPDIYQQLIQDESPVFHASSPEQVAAHLHLLVPDADLRRQAGIRSREFVLKHWSPAANAEQCLQRLGIHH